MAAGGSFIVSLLGTPSVWQCGARLPRQHCLCCSVSLKESPPVTEARQTVQFASIKAAASQVHTNACLTQAVTAVCSMAFSLTRSWCRDVETAGQVIQVKGCCSHPDGRCREHLMVLSKWFFFPEAASALSRAACVTLSLLLCCSQTVTHRLWGHVMVPSKSASVCFVIYVMAWLDACHTLQVSCLRESPGCKQLSVGTSVFAPEQVTCLWSCTLDVFERAELWLSHGRPIRDWSGSPSSRCLAIQ